MNAHGRCILYPAANLHIYTVALLWYHICHTYSYADFIYHSVGFLHCPSQQQGQCEGLRLGMDEANPHAFYFVGV